MASTAVRDWRLLVPLAALCAALFIVTARLVSGDDATYDLPATQACLERSGLSVSYFDFRPDGGAQGLLIGSEQDPVVRLFFARDPEQARGYESSSSEIGGVRGSIFYEGASLDQRVSGCLSTGTS